MSRTLFALSLGFIIALPSIEALAQSNAPTPPPLIIKDEPISSAPVENVVIDITNPTSNTLPEVSGDAVSGLEIQNISEVAPTPLNAQPIRSVVENDLRIPEPPQAKPVSHSAMSSNTVITPDDITGQAYFTPTSTLVNDKISVIENDLAGLQNNIRSLAIELDNLEQENNGLAAAYYASVATVNTQLQAGTTPGNPRLLQRITNAQNDLEALTTNANGLNELAIRIANTASVAAFLMESTRSTYSLTGAVEEDHINLATLEDNVNKSLIVIDRLLNTVNDNITRTTAYLGSERNNLRTLSLAVANGDLYSRSLSNRPFSFARRFDASFSNQAISSPPSAAANTYPQTTSPAPQPQAAQPLQGPRPLVKIRFDTQDVDYEQAVYNAVNEALERYPNAQFDLVAVNPKQGNAAQVAIESTRARRNAERVLRTLTQMGLDGERVDLSYADNEEASVNEVHLYVR